MKIIFLFIYAFGISCTTIHLAVPTQFSEGATQMPVKGLSGWMIKQKLSFGNYKTSVVKKGWNIITTNSGQINDRLLKVFNIDKFVSEVNQRNKYRYSINDGNNMVDIFCAEKLNKEELVIKTNRRILGDWSKTMSSDYSFSAAILPQTVTNDEPWQLVLYSVYEEDKDTARKLFDMPYREEGGYATNGKETITIRPLRIRQVVTKNGKEATMPFKIPMGYELRIEDGVVGVIDTFRNNIWIYNDLDAQTKLILASVSSALMLKKIAG